MKSDFAPGMHIARQADKTPSSTLESFATLINKKILLPSQKTNYIAVEAHFLVVTLKPQVEEIFVDDTWYAAKYADVRAAIAGNLVTSGREHYALHGFYEHRMPYHIIVDEEWYINQYPDVKNAVAEKIFRSGAAHFEEQGYREGRMPYQDFRLKNIYESQ